MGDWDVGIILGLIRKKYLLKYASWKPEGHHQRIIMKFITSKQWGVLIYLLTHFFFRCSTPCIESWTYSPPSLRFSTETHWVNPTQNRGKGSWLRCPYGSTSWDTENSREVGELIWRSKRTYLAQLHWKNKSQVNTGPYVENKNFEIITSLHEIIFISKG